MLSKLRTMASARAANLTSPRVVMETAYHNLDLKLLRSFVEVVAQGHFGRAADALNATQPGISQHIRKLEDRMGCALLNRDAPGVQLTEAGRICHSFAVRVLNTVEVMARQTRAAARGEAGILRVGISTAALNAEILRRLRSLRANRPQIDMQISVNSADILEPMLMQDEIDLAITTIGPHTSEIDGILLQRLPVALSFTDDHPTAMLAKVPISCLSDESVILFPRDRDPLVFDEMIALCRSAGIVPRLIEQPVPFQTVLALVASGAGIGVVPEMLSRTAPEGVVIRPLDVQQPPCFSVSALWHRDTAAPRLACIIEALKLAS